MIVIKDKKALCKKLGYHNLKPCIKKLEFLEENGIEEFLKANFGYDFVFSSELFLKKIIELYGNEVDKKLFEETREKLSRKPGYLFVNTNFRRNNEPIFVLAMCEGIRNIGINRKEFENKNEELEFVKNFVKNHYKENNGKLKIWKDIQNYIYKSDSFDKDLVIDKDGNIVNKIDEFRPNIATLTIK